MGTMLLGAALAGFVHSAGLELAERSLLRDVLARHDHPQLPLHQRVVQLRDEILRTYILEPASELQRKAWLAQRGWLRQTATETLTGKVAFCGDLARVMVKLLRERGIPARRLYLYKSLATNHVLFEYFDAGQNKWVVVNTFASTPYLTQLLDARPLSVTEMFAAAQPEQLVYDKHGYLNRSLFFRVGPARAARVPYAVSWWFDEILLLRMAACLSAAVLLVLLMRRSSGRRAAPGAEKGKEDAAVGGLEGNRAPGLDQAAV